MLLFAESTLSVCIERLRSRIRELIAYSNYGDEGGSCFLLNSFGDGPEELQSSSVQSTKPVTLHSPSLHLVQGHLRKVGHTLRGTGGRDDTTWGFETQLYYFSMLLSREKTDLGLSGHTQLKR